MFDLPNFGLKFNTVPDLKIIEQGRKRFRVPAPTQEPHLESHVRPRNKRGPQKHRERQTSKAPRFSLQLKAAKTAIGPLHRS